MAKKEVLSAEISVEDKASKQLDKIVGSIEKQTLELLKLQKAGASSEKGMDKMTKSVIRQNNEILRLKANLDKTKRSNQKKMKVDVDTKESVRMVDRLERTFRALRTTAGKTASTIKGVWPKLNPLNPLNPGLLLGGAGAIGGVYAGKRIFDGTFGAAAEFEMSEKTIQAMFNNKNKAVEYTKEMEQMAIDSPLLNSQDIFSNSKSYISLTKNQEQLEKMWDLSERLLAVDPKQGIEGAVFALRELFSGDSRSLAMRFELPKKALNDIKNLPLDEQLRALDKYFNKMGMTKKLVNEMGDTTLGVWNQIKETSQVALRTIGEPALNIIRPYLKEVNSALQGGKLNRFVDFGKTMSKGIAKGFVSITKGVGGWIDNIINNPEFQKLDSIPEKFAFVLEESKKTFDGWYEEKGKATMSKIASGLVQTLAGSLQTNMPILIPIAQELGVQVGVGIGTGVINGAKDYITNNWTSILTGAVKPITIPITKGIDAGTTILEKAVEKGTGRKINIPSFSETWDATKKYFRKSNAFGQKRVPYNNYPTMLHEGERVLTKQQANQTERNAGTIQIAKLADQIVIREEADINKFTTALVREIEKHQLGYGGAMG